MPQKKEKTPIKYTIKVLLEGYVFFWVDSDMGTRKFFLYHHARDYRLSITDKTNYLSFAGFSVVEFIKDIFDKSIKVKGVRAFFYKNFRTD